MFEKKIADTELLALDDYITVFAENEYLKEGITYRDTIQSVFIPNVYNSHHNDYQWISNIAHLTPGFVRYSEKQKDKYYSWGNERGIVPLVYQRFYNNIYPTQYKVLEEFILFFNLHEDSRNGHFYSVNMNSDQNLVIQYDSQTTTFRVRTHELRQFLSVKNYVLAVQYDFYRSTVTPLSKYGIDIEKEYNIKTTNGNFLINFNDYSIPSKSYDSRLLGKCFVSGYKDYKHKDQFSIFLDRCESDYLSFITEIDENGQEILESSNTKKYDLNYYKVISFNRLVLQRYYELPNLYTITDGTIIKMGSWRLNIDNNNPHLVKVYLGDLGCLDKSEQSHWLAHNVASSQDLSDVQYKRDVLAVPFLDPEMPDLLFRKYYVIFSEKFKEEFKFSLFKPLHELDQAYLVTVRVPLTESIHEFDKIILNLSKLLCDAIDIKSINNFVKKHYEYKIDALEEFTRTHLSDEKEFVAILRTIQSIRSRSVAHNKDKDYDKLMHKLGYVDKTYTHIITNILVGGAVVLKKWTEILKA